MSKQKSNRGRPKKVKVPLSKEQRKAAVECVDLLRSVVSAYDTYSNGIIATLSNLERLKDSSLRDKYIAEERKRIKGMSDEHYDSLNTDRIEMLEDDISDLKHESDLFLAELLNKIKIDPIKKFLGSFSVRSSKDIPKKFQGVRHKFPINWEAPIVGSRGIAHLETTRNSYLDKARWNIAEWFWLNRVEIRSDSKRSIETVSGFPNGKLRLNTASKLLAGVIPDTPEKIIRKKIIRVAQSNTVTEILTCPETFASGTKARTGPQVAADYVVDQIAGKKPPRTGYSRKARKSKRKSGSA